MLSWRVELLPYLGHEALYQKFALDQPWDSPHNRQLLNLIPDCYVSPERFDSSTNYLAVSGRRYLFNGKPVPLRRVEDGIDNTLAIVEVDDSHAVPWTRPADYAPGTGQLRGGMGHLRPEGIYALWGSGLPTLVAPEVGEQQLHRAFTYESGDGLNAGDIHTELAIRESQQADVVAASAATAAVGESETAASGLKQPSASGNSPAAVGNASRVPGGEEPRLAVPGVGDLAAATEQVETLYAERVKAATTVAQRRGIAREMIAAALEMRSDPAGAYALQSAAVQISAAVGDVQTAGEAVDAQVAMFEVDPLTQNGEMLELVGRASVGAGVVDGRAYLQRALPVLRQAIEENAYGMGEGLCKLATQFESQSRDRALLPALNRLRLQIAAAGNQHQRVEGALAQLRKDPSDRAANSTVGMYLAFIKGDWQQGLNLLAAGDNEQLARISAIDAATPASATAMLSTADAWWDLGEATTQKQFRQASRGRAAFWYAQAMDRMPESLARMHAQARLRETETSGASTPLESIAQLADALGVAPRTTPGSPKSAATR
ncbi:DUF1559 family PulG-like putative transporter [Candidatus Laterigemmans baculatus]|uniref:DUF1559 family PulG-like putative transporter n=1 Tax=Candidatus Laterigemmans baculatus TaxID=2770505 RepID=UPI0013D9797E|nr:DUF1559 domain-containing protein [Candidatus Laterigemmans baculatus]